MLSQLNCLAASSISSVTALTGSLTSAAYESVMFSQASVLKDLWCVFHRGRHPAYRWSWSDSPLRRPCHNGSISMCMDTTLCVYVCADARVSQHLLYVLVYVTVHLTSFSHCQQRICALWCLCLSKMPYYFLSYAGRSCIMGNIFQQITCVIMTNFYYTLCKQPETTAGHYLYRCMAKTTERCSEQ